MTDRHRRGTTQTQEVQALVGGSQCVVTRLLVRRASVATRNHDLASRSYFNRPVTDDLG